jgi:nitroreductase
MNLSEALRGRVSLAKLRPDEVPRELIEQILEDAIWAPVHKMTEPWRFWVWRGDARERLAQLFIENYRRDHPHATAEELAGPGQKTAERIRHAPVTIVVTCDAGRNEIETLENYASTAIATQHILLAAHAAGLGAYWRTGEGAYTQPNALLELLELPGETKIVGLLLLGYPEEQEKKRRRTSASEKTTWFE